MATLNQAPLAQYDELGTFLKGVSTDFLLKLSGGAYLSVSNTARRGDRKWFNFGIAEALITLKDIKDHLLQFASAQRYEEKRWRKLSEVYFSDGNAKSLTQVQTKPVFTLLSKLIHWANAQPITDYSDERIDLSETHLDQAIALLEALVPALSPEAMRPRTETPIVSDPSPKSDTHIPAGFVDRFRQALSAAGFAV